MIDDNFAVRYASGFTVKGDFSFGEGRELIVLSYAKLFVKFEHIDKIIARRFDEKET